MSLEKYATHDTLNTTEYEEGYFTKTGYDGYWDCPEHAIRVEKIINITQPQSVLDVGCAYGYIVKRLLDKGIHAVGMDISHWCEQKAAEIIPRHFVRHDMRQTPYPFRGKEFDVLYCEGVLEHIGAQYIDKIMVEFERISNKRLLALTLEWHIQANPHKSQDGIAPGHLCLHNHNWWFNKMPNYSWLFLPPYGTQDSNMWLYKG